MPTAPEMNTLRLPFGAPIFGFDDGRVGLLTRWFDNASGRTALCRPSTRSRISNPRTLGSFDPLLLLSNPAFAGFLFFISNAASALPFSPPRYQPTCLGSKVWLSFHGLLKFDRVFRVSYPAFFERCKPGSPITRRSALIMVTSKMTL